MHPTTRQRAIDLHDRFTHEGMERREFIHRMAALAGSVAAAEALIAAIAPSPAAAAGVAADDKRLRNSTVTMTVPGIPAYRAYLSQPARPGRRATVLVIHENRGLNFHIRDVARRVALAGYRALAPDLLWPHGGTPGDEDAARAAIGKLDLAEVTGHVARQLASLRGHRTGNGKAGAVGFCWGGGFVNRLAIAAGKNLDAGVAYYGPAPDPSEAVKVQAPLLLHYAGLDQRVNATGMPWVEALKAAGKDVTAYTYPGVNHAFNNDTSAERYDKAASDLAWKRTLAFFSRYLG